MDDMRLTERLVGTDDIKIAARGVQVYYGEKHVIKDVEVDILDRTVTAFIGPSGCGKSTFLRCINLMNDTIPIARMEGKITLDGNDIHVAYGPKIHGLARNRAELDQIEEQSLRRAALWDEVKDRLTGSGLSGGQEQAARVSRRTAFLHLGSLVEYGETGQIFTNPREPRTESHRSGRLG